MFEHVLCYWKAVVIQTSISMLIKKDSYPNRSKWLYRQRFPADRRWFSWTAVPTFLCVCQVTTDFSAHDNNEADEVHAVFSRTSLPADIMTNDCVKLLTACCWVTVEMLHLQPAITALKKQPLSLCCCHSLSEEFRFLIRHCEKCPQWLPVRVSVNSGFMVWKSQAVFPVTDIDSVIRLLLWYLQLWCWRGDEQSCTFSLLLSPFAFPKPRPHIRT